MWEIVERNDRLEPWCKRRDKPITHVRVKRLYSSKTYIDGGSRVGRGSFSFYHVNTASPYGFWFNTRE